MSEKKTLDHSAYGGVRGEDYIPYIPAEEAMPEATGVAIVIGCLFAIIFAVANTYLGLKVGMTISAGIPAVILAAGVLKLIFKKDIVLQANLIQATAAMGESIAAGIIFTLPAIIIWGMQLKMTTIVTVTLLGGLMGVFFVVPLRRFLIVEEHGKLIFPESMAASEILVTSTAGGTGFKTVIYGLLVGGVFKLFSGGFKLWLEEPEWTIKSMQGTVFGFDTLASLLGVGYIIGIEAGLYMFSGALVAWLGLIPLIKYVGAGLNSPLFPSKDIISNMGAWDIWSQYIKYVGAGAVAAGGFISLGKSLPTIVKSFKSAIGGLGHKGEETKRTDRDAPFTWVIGAAVLVFLLSWLLPGVAIGPLGAILVIIFSFFFAVVSARMCGVIGSTNNPVSGMTIATLLFVTAILKSVGYIGTRGMVVAIIAGAIVCISISVSGGAAQGLKTTYIIGGTPKKVEMVMFIGLVVSSVFAGFALLMLDQAYGIGTKEIAAPQATLMSMVVKGVMTAQLPWALVFIGAVFGVMVACMGLPILPVALGMYLPIHLSAAILVGGIVRWLVEKKLKGNEEKIKKHTEKGILLSSGLVAGDALMGIVIAVIATLKLNETIAFGPKIAPGICENPITATVMFFLMAIWIYKHSLKEDNEVGK